MDNLRLTSIMDNIFACIYIYKLLGISVVFVGSSRPEKHQDHDLFLVG